MVKKINKKVEGKCKQCGNDSYVASGWHLGKGLDFCGTECVVKFIKELYSAYRQLEPRIKRLEKEAGIR